MADTWMSQLPDPVRDLLPAQAQQLYESAFDRAWERASRDDEAARAERGAVAHRAAWAELKRSYAQDRQAAARNHANGTSPA